MSTPDSAPELPLRAATNTRVEMRSAPRRRTIARAAWLAIGCVFAPFVSAQTITNDAARTTYLARLDAAIADARGRAQRFPSEMEAVGRRLAALQPPAGQPPPLLALYRTLADRPVHMTLMAQKDGWLPAWRAFASYGEAVRKVVNDEGTADLSLVFGDYDFFGPLSRYEELREHIELLAVQTAAAYYDETLAAVMADLDALVPRRQEAVAAGNADAVREIDARIKQIVEEHTPRVQTIIATIETKLGSVRKAGTALATQLQNLTLPRRASGTGGLPDAERIEDELGLPLPEHLMESYRRIKAREDEDLRIAAELTAALDDPDNIVVDPLALAQRIYGTTDVPPEVLDRLKDRIWRQNEAMADSVTVEVQQLVRAGKMDEARQLLEAVDRQTREKLSAYPEGSALGRRLAQERLDVDFQEVARDLSATERAIAATTDETEMTRLLERQQQLAGRLATLATRQGEIASARLADGDQGEARRALLLESSMWELAARHSGDSDALALGERAADASSKLLILSAGRSENRTVALLRHAQVQAERGIPRYTGSLEEWKTRNALLSASNSYKEAVETAEGEGGDLVRAYLKGGVSSEDLGAALARLPTDEYSKATALLLTGRELQTRFDRASRAARQESARAMLVKLDDVERAWSGDTERMQRFQEKMKDVQDYWAQVEARREALARFTGSNEKREELGRELETMMDNADSKWYDLYYDYQSAVHGDGNFNQKIYSPFSNRTIVVRRDAEHPRKNIHVAFSEIEADRNYFFYMSPEETVRLGYTTIAVLGASLIAGPASAALAEVVVAPIATVAVQHVVRGAVQIGAEAVVSTAAENYIVAPLLNNTALRGTGVEVGRPYAGSLGAELRAFASESAMNAVMGFAMAGPGKIATKRADLLAESMARAGHNPLLRAAASGAVEQTYKFAGLAGVGALRETVVARFEGREFNADAWRAETLNGIATSALSDPGAFRRFRGSGDGAAGADRYRTTPEERAQIVGLLHAESEFAATREALVREAARPEADAGLLGRLRHDMEVSRAAVHERLEGMRETLGSEVVDANQRAVRNTAAVLDGVASGAESGVRIRERVAEVDPWEMSRLRSNLESAGLEVKPGREGFTARDPHTGEEALFLERRFASPEERRTARRRAEVRENLRRAEIERLARLPEEERGYFREKFATRWDDLGRPDAHATPENAARGQRAREAMAGVVRTHDADLVAVPNLAREHGRRAEVARVNGRWRVAYDPAEATFLDIKEEVRHLGREVATGRFSPEGRISRTDERIAEIREAQDRLDRLRAVGADPDTLADAANRVRDELDLARRVVGDDAPVEVLRSPFDIDAEFVPEARGRVQRVINATRDRMHQMMALAERGMVAAETIKQRRADDPAIMRHVERIERDAQIANRFAEQLGEELSRLRDLFDAVSDPTEARRVLDNPPEVPPLRLPDLPRISVDPGDIAPVGNTAFTGPALTNMQARIAAATTPDQRRHASQQLGEAAAGPLGPGFALIRQQLEAAHGPGLQCDLLFQGLTATAGVFDFVYAVRRPSDGSIVTVVIVEAKGGSADVGTRFVTLSGDHFSERDGIFDADQGTPEHTMSTIYALKSRRSLSATEEKVVSTDLPLLEQALADGKIQFFISRARTPTDIEVTEVRNQPWADVHDAYTKQAADFAAFAAPDVALELGLTQAPHRQR